MTKQEFIAFVNSLGDPARVIAIVMETNWTSILYLDDGHILDLEKDIVTISGVDYIKQYTIGKDTRPEKRLSNEYVITTYHPIESIQAIQTIESADVRKYLDKSDLYDMYVK